MSDEETYDVVIVGAGVTGAVMAKQLTHAGLRVLVLEAGPATAWSFEGYTRHLRAVLRGRGQEPRVGLAGEPQRPAPRHPRHPQRRRLLRAERAGPVRLSYTRLQGGSTLHWLGVSLRMLPEDFELRTRFGVGRDWPLGYDELEPYYRAAERELGVAADVADQTHSGDDVRRRLRLPDAAGPVELLRRGAR